MLKRTLPSPTNMLLLFYEFWLRRRQPKQELSMQVRLSKRCDSKRYKSKESRRLPRKLLLPCVFCFRVGNLWKQAQHLRRRWQRQRWRVELSGYVTKMSLFLSGSTILASGIPPLWTSSTWKWSRVPFWFCSIDKMSRSTTRGHQIWLALLRCMLRTRVAQLKLKLNNSYFQFVYIRYLLVVFKNNNFFLKCEVNMKCEDVLLTEIWNGFESRCRNLIGRMVGCYQTVGFLAARSRSINLIQSDHLIAIVEGLVSGSSRPDSNQTCSLIRMIEVIGLSPSICCVCIYFIKNNYFLEMLFDR